MSPQRKVVYLDFDGTLIESRPRLYRLFRELVPEAEFGFEEYWAIKRTRITQAQMLERYFGYPPERIAEVKRLWMQRIEEDARLLSDEPFDGVTALLQEMSGLCLLCLVTARQNPALVLQQLASFGWSSFFQQVLVTEQTATKEELIRRYGSPTPEHIFVGDTGEDIHTGKALGVKTVAVASGILSREVLEEYSPDLLLNHVLELYEHRSLWC